MGKMGKGVKTEVMIFYLLRLELVVTIGTFGTTWAVFINHQT